MDIPKFSRLEFVEKLKDKIVIGLRERITIANLESFGPFLVAVVIKFIQIIPGKNGMRIVMCEAGWQYLIEKYNTPINISLLELVKKEISDPIAGVFCISKGKSFMLPQKPLNDADKVQLVDQFENNEALGTPSFIISYDDDTRDPLIWALPYDTDGENIIFYKDNFIEQYGVLDIKYNTKK